jgi:TetR/AcrR family transcriptional regulator, tetracycline repressor protein
MIVMPSSPATSRDALNAAEAMPERSCGMVRNSASVSGTLSPEPMPISRKPGGALYIALMLVMSEPGYEPGLSEQERAEVQRRKMIELASLPPDRYPRLVAAAGPMTACDDPEFHYRFGVDLFIAGMEAIARQQAG